MELYLDSADINEIEDAAKLGFLTGLTTTPTFMFRDAVSDIDHLITRLAGMMPILQIEALGSSAEDILNEAKKKLDLGLDPKKTVFKVPVSQEGVRACHLLRQENLLVNIHLVYTLQQAYMAMLSGATYVCPLVGRLQDQGHDALMLIDQCVDMVDHYNFDTKIMFSSVRNVEHVRNAINLGVHAITAPWKIIKQLTKNHFTDVGTAQFIEHTRLITVKVKEAISRKNPIVTADTALIDAIVKMTEYGFGAITIVEPNGTLVGVFTDGDLRRQLQQAGRDVLQKKMSDFSYRKPITIAANALLLEASAIFERAKVDTLLVIHDNKPIGMLDIQDLMGGGNTLKCINHIF